MQSKKRRLGAEQLVLKRKAMRVLNPEEVELVAGGTGTNQTDQCDTTNSGATCDATDGCVTGTCGCGHPTVGCPNPTTIDATCPG
jgi:hypothetical protein